MHKPATEGCDCDARHGRMILFVRRFGGFNERRIPVEAEIYELRRVALNDPGGGISFVDLMELEINFSTLVDRAEKQAVNLGARFFGMRGIRRQRVAHGPAGADDPARQLAAIRFPLLLN